MEFFCPSRLARALLIEKAETGSTNDDARTLALAGAPHGSAVLARLQTRGRGRAGRSFLSPVGGLYMSVVLRPKLAPAQWGLLSLAFALEAAQQLRALGFPVDVKWPNDLLVGGRKLAGILAESRTGPDPFVIVGIGLNVDRAPDGVPDATALALAGAPPTVPELAARLREGFVARLAALEKEGPGPTLDALREACVTLGKKVEWEKGEGVAVDVAEDGALVVRDAQGREQRVLAGDVRLKTV